MIVLPSVPVWIHTVFESIAFWVGGVVYARTRKDDTLPADQRSLVMGACILGAAIGCKLTVWADTPQVILGHGASLEGLLPGKGIAGALVGGLIGVELAKKCLKITQSTGDVLVYPLMWALIVGRMGCFFAGLSDATYGTPTTLPWAVDFGDGIGRHPTQVYEMVFLLLWMAVIALRKQKPYGQGHVFAWFMLGYFGFRFGVEFIKPIVPLYWGLNSVQVLSLCVLVYYYQRIVGLFGWGCIPVNAAVAEDVTSDG